MDKLKDKIKQFFCRHKYGRSHLGLGNKCFMTITKCSKCGKLED